MIQTIARKVKIDLGAFMNRDNNVTDDVGQTPLHIATMYCDRSTVQWLIMCIY